MPKRTINTRRNKADAATDLAAATDAAPVPATDAATDAVATADAAPANVDTTNVDTTIVELNAINDLLTGDTDSLTITGIDGTEYTITTDADGVATTTTTPATPDAKAAFLERKAAATTSVLPLYAGASLAVHRSDRQPADAKYIERVASPVQKIGPNGPTPRDNSFMLAVYDFFVAYRGSDFSGGFNPAQFGADLGTTSRAASVGYLSTDLSDIYLTDAGRVRGANLAAKRAKA